MALAVSYQLTTDSHKWWLCSILVITVSVLTTTTTHGCLIQRKPAQANSGGGAASTGSASSLIDVNKGQSQGQSGNKAPSSSTEKNIVVTFKACTERPGDKNYLPCFNGGICQFHSANAFRDGQKIVQIFRQCHCTDDFKGIYCHLRKIDPIYDSTRHSSESQTASIKVVMVFILVLFILILILGISMYSYLWRRYRQRMRNEKSGSAADEDEVDASREITQYNKKGKPFQHKTFEQKSYNDFTGMNEAAFVTANLKNDGHETELLAVSYEDTVQHESAV